MNLKFDVPEGKRMSDIEEAEEIFGNPEKYWGSENWCVACDVIIAALKERNRELEDYHNAYLGCPTNFTAPDVEALKERISDLEEQLEVCKGGRMVIEMRDKRIKELEAENLRCITANVDIAKANADLVERITELEAEREWKTIESAPLDKWVLVTDASSHHCWSSIYATEKSKPSIFGETHWKPISPLPEPPKERE